MTKNNTGTSLQTNDVDANTSSSMAKNYFTPLTSEINTRTGNLGLTLSPPILKDMVGMPLNLGVVYIQNNTFSNENLFGLPQGWSYQLSYIAKNRITINGAQSYDLNKNTPSGMKLYEQKNLKLEFFSPFNYPLLPYDKSQSYAYLLRNLDGHNQYFDSDGKLICIDDKSSNHQLYYYDAQSNIFKSRLIEVITTNGKSVKIDFKLDEIRISFPDGGKNNIQFSYITEIQNSRLIKYVNPVGEFTTLEYKGEMTKRNLLSKITYPSQLVVEYEYSVIQYRAGDSTHDCDVVVKVSRSYGGTTRVTNYNYNGKGDHHNYLGYPIYPLEPGKDALLESNNNRYKYYTIVDNGITSITHEYNRLHLKLSSTVKTISGASISESNIVYYGQKDDDYFPPFNQLPPNYQYEKEKTNLLYNEEGRTKTTKMTTEYNDYGQIINKTKYEEHEESLQVIEETITAYDPNYGEIIQEDKKDFQPQGSIVPTPLIIRTVNTLTNDDDNKQIKSSQIGAVVGALFTPERHVEYLYDAEGRVISEQRTWSNSVQREGIDKTGITYDFEKNNEETVIEKRTIDFEGYASKEYYDMSSGFLLSKEDALGSKEIFVYDNSERIVSHTNTMGAVLKTEYISSENKVVETNEMGYVICTFYNGFGDCIKKIDFPKLNGNERTLECNEYNSLGQLVSRSGIYGTESKIVNTYNEQGFLETKVDAQGNISKYTYDPVRLLKETFFNSVRTCEEKYNLQKNIIQRTNFSDIDCSTKLASKRYNGLELDVETKVGLDSENWTVRKLKYDIFNNQIKQVNSGFDGVALTNHFTRDLLDNILQSTHILSSSLNDDHCEKMSAKQIYNALGRLAKEVTPLNNINEFTYDAVGNVETSISFDGNIIKQTYFPNNMVKSKSYSEKDGTSVLVNYTYYSTSNLLASVEEIRNGNNCGLTSYTYTLDGLLSEMTYLDGKVMSWEYNNEGFLTKFTDVVGEHINYEYDKYARVKMVSNKNSKQDVQFFYYSTEAKENSGKIESVLYSNGIRLKYQYSGFNHVSKLDILNSCSQVLLSVGYTYDNAGGNIKSVKYRSDVQSDDILNYNVYYQYNGINQLIVEKRENINDDVISITDYMYDAAANIVTTTTRDTNETIAVNYTYDADDKLKVIESSEGIRELTYDDNGNLTKDENGNLFEYNVLNQLVTYRKKEGKVTNYCYYPSGLRCSKTISGEQPISYYYNNDEDAKIVNELQSGTSISYLIYNESRFVRLYNDGADTTAEYLCQNFKDVLLVVDEQENIVSKYLYTAYGESDDKNNDYSISSNPFMYNMEYLDFESDLYYLRARYYSPKLISFITRDSIIIFNHYAYANGNPIMNIDPSGHYSSGAEITGGQTLNTELGGGCVVDIGGRLNANNHTGPNTSVWANVVVQEYGVVMADTGAGANLFEFHSDDSQYSVDIQAFGIEAGASAEAGITGFSVEAVAEVKMIELEGAGVGGRLALAATTGVSAGLGGVEIKVGGTGFSIGKKTGISILGSEIYIDFPKLFKALKFW
jgi:RHS repeat-associated protein